jgi:hypothetical protein
LLVVILSAAVAAVIATALSQKQRLQVLDAEERRQYLGSKLGGRISDEQIDRLAAAISTRLDAAASATQAESEGQPESEGEPESEGDGAETSTTDS